MAVTSSSAVGFAGGIACPIKGGLSKAAFERVFSEGSRLTGRYMRLMALPGEGRLGIATPKKVGSHARRNRLKRRIREAIRASSIPRSDVDLVVSAFAAADEAPFAELVTECEALLHKMRERWENESASS